MNANTLVRSVFGFSRMNIQPLVVAVELAHQLIFTQHRNRSSIQLVWDIHAPVAELLGKSPCAVTQQLGRLCSRCRYLIWKDEDQMKRLVGPHPRDMDGPSEVIFLLACYLEYEKSFEEVLDQEPGLMF